VVIAVLAAVVALMTAIAVLAFTGIGKHIPGIKNLTIGGHNEAPARCLDGTVPPGGHVPNRPALAIKVENLPEARPQAGLDKADIVYEEQVEGGITRFIVVFDCENSKRLGPVRSARLTDPPILLQFGKDTLFGFAGAAGRVRKAVDASGVHDLSYDRPRSAGAYVRDPNRPEPHNLYTSTKALYRAAHLKDHGPRQVFQYGPISSPAKPVSTIHLDFSASADVFWHWSAQRKAWLRFHGTVPHLLEGGVQVSATNVVVMHVVMKDTGLVDAAGNPSPEADTVGKGKAFVFRDGEMIKGRWSRKSRDHVIQLVDRHGKPIDLQPGRTWVELLPTTVPVQVS
jgi:hypothetical protein